MGRAAAPPGRDRRAASSARRCALRVLRRVHAEGAYADLALPAEAERAALDPRERAFAERLAHGAVQRRATLDHAIAAAADRPPERIDPAVLDALRLGALQLLLLDGVPDRAAVDQTVELVREAAGERPAGFANAVMRRIAREGRARLAELDDATPAAAAVLHSHPRWIAERWWAELGPDEARALLAAGNEPPETALRVNTLAASREEVLERLERAGVTARPDAELPEAVVVEGRIDLARSELFASGAVTPQSRASMLVARVLGPRPGERVLDLCAAPGAKTTHIAALMEGRGTVVACDADPARAEALRAMRRRLRCGHVEVRTGDARTAALGEGYDRVLLDPPCSDLGTLAARPDARWRKAPDQLDRLAALQRELLAAAAGRLRPGGTLVYSTCTISEAENAARVAALLADRRDLRADDLGAEHPGLRHPRHPRFLQTLPHRHRTAGFFIARLTRSPQ